MHRVVPAGAGAECCDATISNVAKHPPSFTRRKLAAVVRKAMISYYTEEERQEIREAAKRNRVSLSSFIAAAALKEARRVIRGSR